MSQTIRTIGTHNGEFHSDDIFAVATLLMLYPKAKVARTRDEKILEGLDLIVDVGAEYDHRNHRYDHHQQEFNETHQNGIKRSGFGLIWKHFGLELTKSEYVWQRIDASLVETIDAIDNGQPIVGENAYNTNVVTISDYFGDFNPLNQPSQSPEYDTQFFNQVNKAQDYLGILIRKYSLQERDEKEFMTIYKNSPSKQWVVLDAPIQFKEIALTVSELLYVIHPDSSAGWGILAIPVDSGHPFSQRLPFPKEWRGKKDDDLQEVTEIKGVLFCHANGFYGVTKTQKQAINLVKKSIELQKNYTT